MLTTTGTRFFLALILIGVVPGSALAQEFAGGDRVRLTIRPSAPQHRYPTSLTGMIVSADSVNVVVQTDAGGAPRTFSRDEIMRAERGRTHHNWDTGLLVGTGVGLVVAALFHSVSVQTLAGPAQAGRGALIAVPACALIGAAIGSGVKSERWKRIEPEGLAFGIQNGESPAVVVSWSSGF